MQNAKFLLALGVLAVASLSLQVQAGPDTPEQAKMREALRRTMEQSTAPATAPPPAATPVAPPPATTKTEAVPPPAQPAYESVPPPVDPTRAEREREAMRKKIAEPQTTPAPVPTTPVAPAPVQSAYKPIEVPASSLATSKQARLSDLLVRYKADTITALEYHTQRAAIIAEP